MDAILKAILDFLSSFPTYFSLCYPILYLSKFKNNNMAYRYFTIYLVLIGLVQLVMRLVIKLDLTETNLYMFVYFMTFQFIFLSMFFYSLLKHRVILLLMGVVLSFLLIQYLLDPTLYFKYNPIGIVVTQIVLVLYSLVYFYKSLSLKEEFVIVNYGIFIYLISSVLIFASGNLVFNKFVPEVVLSNLNDLNLVLYFVFQLFIVIEWVKNYSGWFKKTSRN